MSCQNRDTFDGHVDPVCCFLVCQSDALLSRYRKSTFDFTFRLDEPAIDYTRLATQPLRYTKSNNAVSSFREQSREDTSMLRSRSDFAFTDSTGVGADSFLRPNSLSLYPSWTFTPSGLQEQGPLPINKFLTEGDSPWTGLQTPRKNRTASAFDERSVYYPTFRAHPKSEIESNTTSQCHSDSGYASQPVISQSVKSGGYSASSPDYSFFPDFEAFSFPPMPETPASPHGPAEAASTKSTQRSRRGKRKCEKCNEILKCPSDHRCVSL